MVSQVPGLKVVPSKSIRLNSNNSSALTTKLTLKQLLTCSLMVPRLVTAVMISLLLLLSLEATAVLSTSLSIKRLSSPPLVKHSLNKLVVSPPNTLSPWVLLPIMLNQLLTIRLRLPARVTFKFFLTLSLLLLTAAFLFAMSTSMISNSWAIAKSQTGKALCSPLTLVKSAPNSHATISVLNLDSEARIRPATSLLLFPN